MPCNPRIVLVLSLSRQPANVAACHAAAYRPVVLGGRGQPRRRSSRPREPATVACRAVASRPVIPPGACHKPYRDTNLFRPGRQKLMQSRRPERHSKEGEDGNQDPILEPGDLPTGMDQEHLRFLASGPRTVREHLRSMASGSMICSIPAVKWSEQFPQDVQAAAIEDNQCQQGLKALDSEQGRENNAALSLENGLLHHKSRLYVPQGLRKEVLRFEHDSKVAGHFGQDTAVELIGRNFWWPGMKAEIIEYIRFCPHASRIRPDVTSGMDCCHPSNSLTPSLPGGIGEKEIRDTSL